MKLRFKIPFVLAIGAMAGVLAWLIWKWSVPVTFLFSGEVFTTQFEYVYTGGASDSFRVGLNKVFIVAAILTAVVVPVIAVLLVLADLRRRIEKIIFLLVSLALCLFPVSAMSVAVVALSRYILDMGVTRARIAGVTCGLFGIAAMVAFVFWTIRRLKGKPEGK